MAKGSFILYYEYYEHLKDLSLEEKGKIFEAIFEYELTGKTPVLTPVLKMAFSFIKEDIDINANKWEQTKSRRSEAGKLGGLAKASNAKQSLANLAVNVNENVNVNVNDNNIGHFSDEKAKPTPKKNFIKPSLKEIQDYCTERKNTVSAIKFYNFYESKGWKVGKSPMKNWKACVHTWEEPKPQEEAPKPDKYAKVIARSMN